MKNGYQPKAKEGFGLTIPPFETPIDKYKIKLEKDIKLIQLKHIRDMMKYRTTDETIGALLDFIEEEII